MAADLKPVGKAVALSKGHYPDESGRHLTILPGQTFTVWEGRTKGSWFKPVSEAAAPAAKPPAPQSPETLAAAAAAERKRKAAVKAPTEDDIA